MASTIKVNMLDTNSGSDITIAATKNIAGANTQFKITGGSANNFLKTDGSGALSWGTPTAGKVLHIEQVVKTDTTSTTVLYSAVADITGMTVTMPASVATSRYLVFWSLSLGITANESFALVLTRVVGGVEVTPLLGDAAGSRKRASSAQMTAHAEGIVMSAIQYLDSPATTSAVTYKIKWGLNYAGTGYLNRHHSDVDSATYGRTASSITVMEIGV